MVRTRFKRANIFFFLLLTALILYFANRQKVDTKLRQWGIVPEQQQPASMPPDSLPAAADTTLFEQPLPDEVNISDPVLPQWQILTQNGKSEFYANATPPNLFTIVTRQMPVQQVTPVVNGSGVTIETVDAKQGLYRLKATQTGSAAISLFYTNNQGATDVLGSQSITILPASGASNANNSGYLWHIATAQPDTLFANQPNPLLIAVSGNIMPAIEPIISGSGNYLTPVDAPNGSYQAFVSGANTTVTITLRATNGGKPTLVGSKTWVIGNKEGILPTLATQTPSNVLITAASAYVLYAGIPNKVQIWQPANQPNLKITSDNGNVSELVGNVLTVTPANTGALTLTVFASNQPSTPIGQQRFEVAPMPNPSPAISGNTGGAITAATLKRATQLDLQPAVGFEQMPFTIVSFEAYWYNAGKSLAKLPNSGSNFSPELLQLLQTAAPADLLYITNLTIADNNGNRRSLPDITFMVR